MVVTHNTFTVDEYVLFCERMTDFGLFEYDNGSIKPVQEPQAISGELVYYVLSKNFNPDEINIIRFAMPTQTHDDIIANLLSEFYQFLDQSVFRIYAQATSVAIPELKKVRDPDIVIVQKNNQQRNKLHQILNPKILIEVLSKSTANIDKTVKLAEYKTIRTLSTYIIVAQNKIKATIYKRIQEDLWYEQILTQKEDKIDIEEIGLQISLASIYAGIDFTLK
jgi:Uma2 family endonuclease